MTRNGNKADWSNYWQGRTANASGDALVGGVGIEHSKELADFWSKELGGFAPQVSILDLACGAGSVLRHAHRLGFQDVSGIDISDDAIAAMQSSIPNAKGMVGPVDKMPFGDANFDLVVSQYGFEYAGGEDAILKTTQEIARVLKDDGHFIAVCHIKDGGIDREVRGHLTAIETLENTGFIRASKDLFHALYAAYNDPIEASKQNFNTAAAALIEPREALNQFINASGAADDQIKQLAQHLMAGAADLYKRHQAYALEDVMGWLTGMQSEIDAYKGRMASMRNAALDEAVCQSLLSVFESAGYSPASPTPLHFGDEPHPAAWILKAGWM